MIRERHLFGPGPSNPYPEATRALAEPLLGHLDPEFLRVMDETCDMLRTVWGTDNARTLPLSATGSAGMEAAFVNTVHPGDVVVVAVNGLFGQRMTDVAARCGAEVVAVEHDWGQPVDVDRVLSAHDSPAIVAAVHAETSTGVRSDIAALGAGLRSQGNDALLLVDAVTSIGGIELRADDWESTSATPARRSASASRPAWRRSPSTTVPSSAASRSRARGTSTSACSAATSARRASGADSAPTTTPRPPRWSPASTAA
jgi:alanine-glyoxylate transaminase/serine-glyoxylate transaminase/serine-pyruvate transaminase